ncbi:hypothetical protein HOH87_07415 [bacterium]|jgi:hypothetical protein|nr:hypothetical protein [bacterium]
MDEILGLVDAIEAAIHDAKKVPLSNKIMIEEVRMTSMVQKLRKMVKRAQEQQYQNEELAAKVMPVTDIRPEVDLNPQPIDDKVSGELTEVEEREAQRNAQGIKRGANEYADQILSRLQLSVTKLQKNLVRIDKNIDEGRKLIEEAQREY